MFTSNTDQLSEDGASSDSSQEDDFPRKNYNQLLHVAIHNINKRAQKLRNGSGSIKSLDEKIEEDFPEPRKRKRAYMFRGLDALEMD